MRSGFINRSAVSLLTKYLASGSITSPSVEIPHNFNFSEGRKLQLTKYYKMLIVKMRKSLETRGVNFGAKYVSYFALLS